MVQLFGKRGEVTEWLMVLVLKTSVGQLTASSNLALSAMKTVETIVSAFFILPSAIR